jgi:hypothetical protein
MSEESFCDVQDCKKRTECYHSKSPKCFRKLVLEGWDLTEPSTLFAILSVSYLAWITYLIVVLFYG